LDELSRSNNDMKNLLNSTDIATLFLDGSLRVRRFTTPVASIIKLIQSDIGRPITDIAREIDYADLVEHAREVLRTLVIRETLVRATNDRWFAVRIMPYRTLENVIDGVVITFTDAGMARLMGATLREQASELRQMAESLPQLVWSCRPDGECEYMSPQWAEYTGVPTGELLGYEWLNTVDGRDRERVRGAWKSAVAEEIPLNVELRLRAKDGSMRWFSARAAPIRDAAGKVTKWYGSNSDIDDLKRVAERRSEAAEQLQAIIQELEAPVFTLAANQSIASLNGAARRLLGKSGDAVGKDFFEVLPQLDRDVFEERRRRSATHDGVATFDIDLALDHSSFQVRLFSGPGSSLVLLQQTTGRNNSGDGD
jgi:two-component system CheB/CheR fusion protein